MRIQETIEALYRIVNLAAYAVTTMQKSGNRHYYDSATLTVENWVLDLQWLKVETGLLHDAPEFSINKWRREFDQACRRRSTEFVTLHDTPTDVIVRPSAVTNYIESKIIDHQRCGYDKISQVELRTVGSLALWVISELESSGHSGRKFSVAGDYSHNTSMGMF